MRGLIVALGLAIAGTGLVAEAKAQSWERALVQRYSSKEICDERGAPAWGRASMQRWRAGQYRQQQPSSGRRDRWH